MIFNNKSKIIILLIGGVLILFFFYKNLTSSKYHESKNLYSASLKKKKPAVSPSKLIYSKKYKFDTVAKIHDLFSKLNIKYSNKPIFNIKCRDFSNLSPEDYSLYNKYTKKKHDTLTTKYEDDIISGYVVPMYIKWTNDKIGYGCFAKKGIPKGTLIAEYVGEIIPKNEITSKVWSWKYPSKGSFSNKFPSNISLNSARVANETHFINHSDIPNTYTEFIYANNSWHLVYISNKFIEKDQEITITYGSKYWNKKTKFDI